MVIIRFGDAVNGNIGSMTLKRPYPPILSMTKSTLPAVGASVYASGCHEWNGKLGILTMKPKSSARNIISFTAPDSMNWNWLMSVGISNVGVPVMSHAAK